MNSKPMIATIRHALSLPPWEETYSQNLTNKAGVVPFCKMETANGKAEFAFYLMQPQPKNGFNTPPPWQIAKGTMQYIDNEGNATGEDVPACLETAIARPDPTRQYESPINAAIRESAEEIGLIWDQATDHYLCGIIPFISESSGITKTMHLFAVYISHTESATAFDPALLHDTTAQHQWIRSSELEDFRVRVDHLKILRALEQALNNVHTKC